MTVRLPDVCDRMERELLAPAPAAGAPYRQPGLDVEEVSARWHELGRMQWQVARFPAAERSLGRALELREAAFGPSDSRTLDTRERIAALLHYTMREEAGTAFEAILAARTALHGRDHVVTAITLRNWGTLLRDRNDPRAGSVLEEARRTLEQRLGREHPEVVAALKAQALWRVYAEPRAWATLRDAEQAYGLALRVHGDDHPFTAAALLIAARAETKIQRPRPARRHLAAAMPILVAAYGEEHPLVALTHSAEADLGIAIGDYDAAAVASERAYDVYALTYSGHHLLWYALRAMVSHRARGDLENARPWAVRARLLVTEDSFSAHQELIAIADELLAVR